MYQIGTGLILIFKQDNKGWKNPTLSLKYGISPCKVRFGETNCLNEDAQNLCMFCLIHTCNDYCMRKSKTGNNDDNKKLMRESLVCA
jgi:hypothetical protein